MITGGDANLSDPPQFGFSFQFSADVFSVRLIALLNEAAVAAEKTNSQSLSISQSGYNFLEWSNAGPHSDGRSLP